MLLKKSFIIAIVFVLLSKFTLAGWTVGMNTTQNDTICFGTVLKLSAYTNTGCSIYWDISPSVSGYPKYDSSTVHISFPTPGQYWVSIHTYGPCGWSIYAYEMYTVLPLPVVSLSTSIDSICNTSGIINLAGGSPTSGNYYGNGILGNSFDPSIFTSDDSTYIHYEYSDFFGCSYKDSAKIFIKTDCETQQSNEISVFPNPTNGKLTFTGAIAEVSITDLMGKEVMHFFSTNQTSVFLNTNAGIYVYSIKDKNGGIATGKIILTK